MRSFAKFLRLGPRNKIYLCIHWIYRRSLEVFGSMSCYNVDEVL